MDVRKLTLLFLTSIPVTGICGDPLEDAVLRSKALPATVKIDIVLRDARHQAVAEYSGQGVRISPSGLVLTAAHVAIPTVAAFNASNATRYDVVVKRFDLKTGQYEPLPIAFPDDIRTVALYESGLDDASFRACRDDSKQPCIHTTIQPSSDYVILDTGVQSDSFIDVIGPFDLLHSLMRQDLEFGVISDFAWSGAPEYSKASTAVPPEAIKRDLLFKLQTGTIKPRDSGSPLVAWNADGRKSIYVAGIVVSNKPEDITLTKFKAALVPDILTLDVLTSLRKSERFVSTSMPFWDCLQSQAQFPGPNTILRDFLLLAAKDEQDLTRNQSTINCGLATRGWVHSFNSLIFARQQKVREIIEGLAGFGTVNCDGDNCAVGDGNPPSSSVQALAVRREAIEKLREAELKKLETFQGESSGSGCSASDNCYIAVTMPPDAIESHVRAAQLREELQRIDLALSYAKAEQSAVDLLNVSSQAGADPKGVLMVSELRRTMSGVSNALETINAFEAGQQVKGLSESAAGAMKSAAGERASTTGVLP